MEPILVHPSSVEQLNVFSPYVLKGIEESIKQHENNETISLKEFKEKYLAI